MAYNVGLAGPYDYLGVVRSDFFAAAAIYFADFAPLVTRLRNVPTAAIAVKAVDDAFRPRVMALEDAAGVNNTVTTFTVLDASSFLNGDVIQVESELALVTAANMTANTITVARGYAGTVAAAHATGTVVNLVSNTRTGAEVDQDALTRVLDTSETYPQTVQHPYQIGGATEASSRNMAIPSGYASLVGYQRAKAMRELVYDFELSCYYGRALAPASDSTRPMMRGLRQRLTTNAVTDPTGKTAYKPSDFERDVISPILSAGGRPDVVLVSNEYRVGFAVWGISLTQLRPGDNQLGINVTTWQPQSSIAGGALVIYSPLLRPYTAIGLSSDEVYMAWKREPNDKPRGSRGDAVEGDIIGEGCLVANNEKHHTFVTGVTGFAKQS